jgi:pyridoxal phosphate enzyme (YggS family)
MSIKDNLLKIKSTIPKHVSLVAVSKTKPNEMIQDAYDTNQKHFGENKVQDLVDKHETLPKDINWHFIGHLQTNKVKFIAPFIHLIHAVDSIKLLKEINKQAINNERIIDILLQFHIADEDSKFGLKYEDAETLLDSPEFYNLKNIRVVGVMGMATFTDDKNQIRTEFRTLQNYFEILKSGKFKFADYFTEISMGMSGDYELAIEEGSTMVRVGSSIFGMR